MADDSRSEHDVALTPRTGREFHLAARPRGWPIPADFALVETPIPPLDVDQVLIKNLYLSVDPYMRGRMNAVRSYAPPYQLNEVMYGGAVGEVIASRSDRLEVGDLVTHNLGWREFAVTDASAAGRVPNAGGPGIGLSAYLGVLGMTGLTAYLGMVDVAGVRPGETVFVSGAAGAVGSVAGQIAKLRGAGRVVGSAGSAEKVSYLVDELGFDAAFNYKDGRVAEQLAAAAPDGIDVFFDNVGGEHMEAAIDAFHDHGRAALCGAISVYNETSPPPGPRNLGQLVSKRLRLEGFLVSDHFDRRADFLAEVGPWVRDGALSSRETIVDGFEHAVDAFLGLLRGENVGKMVVRVDAE